ncbi:hypothetical protein O6P43_001626 [Quillaja saponaria]|uniref:Uncharacterized protein n=1 Tax=Quillaja saponaria TaxID=32244 RepID=A0AAD7VNX2_QUISA|nr:hypothetical protein O6P43_001626 [Quillaja saponaria]
MRTISYCMKDILNQARTKRTRRQIHHLSLPPQIISEQFVKISQPNKKLNSGKSLNPPYLFKNRQIYRRRSTPEKGSSRTSRKFTI